MPTDLQKKNTCPTCGKPRYGKFRDTKARLIDLFYEKLAYQDPSDPSGSTWIFREQLPPDELLDKILEVI